MTVPRQTSKKHPQADVRLVPIHDCPRIKRLGPIHAHVEPVVAAKTKASRRLIQLVRRHAEIKQDAADVVNPPLCELDSDVPKIVMDKRCLSTKSR